MLLLKDSEENDNERFARAEREERSTYTPPPRSALHNVKELSLTETLLLSVHTTYIAPPFPEEALQEVKVVLHSSVPVMHSVFPSPSLPQITLPFVYVDDASERVMFSK